jgi:hypothetical protein
MAPGPAGCRHLATLRGLSIADVLLSLLTTIQRTPIGLLGPAHCTEIILTHPDPHANPFERTEPVAHWYGAS